MTEIQAALLSMQDLDYRSFQCALMPTVPQEKVIGVRMPQLRKFAKSLSDAADDFLAALPHTYYEEDNIHGILISQITNPEAAILALDSYLPYVDNWATCDLIAPKAFTSRPAILLTAVSRWLQSHHTYTVRYAIGVLMRYYLDNGFSREYLSMVADIRSDEYYVNMMIAWYFATALSKQYDEAVLYLTRNKLSTWCHNKTIQKAVESYRITDTQKEYLKTLRYK